MTIKKIAVTILVTAVSVLTLVAVLSIWDVFSKDTLGKALGTIGVVAFGSLIVIIASKEVERKNEHTPLPPLQ
jgi:ABC-type lipoprotein release transport system permease subunit